MTLGQLIEALEVFNADARVLLHDQPPGEFCSYRGSYDHLALIPGGETQTTVGRLLQRCRAADGSTFQGWKGGDYEMGLGTPVWVADEGQYPGLALIGITPRGDGASLELLTADIEEYQW